MKKKQKENFHFCAKIFFLRSKIYFEGIKTFFFKNDKQFLDKTDELKLNDKQFLL